MPIVKGNPIWWTRERKIAALQAEVARTGRVPCARDWRRASINHPHIKTVYDDFSSWYEFCADAGFTYTPRDAQERRASVARRDRQEMIDFLLDWRCKHGRWPLSREVRGYNTYRKEFGSLRAAIAKARGGRDVHANNRRDTIPVEPIRNLLLAHLEGRCEREGQTIEDAATAFAESCGMTYSTIEPVMYEKKHRQTITRAKADKIVSAIDPSLWQNELAEWADSESTTDASRTALESACAAGVGSEVTA